MTNQSHRVLDIEHLTPETFVLHIERKDFMFEPGQYVVLRDPETGEGREYSIYSSILEDRLSFLVREVKRGDFSRFLKNLKWNDELIVEGPNGFFILDEKNKNGTPALFIATGTGISPFYSFVKSFPDLNYTTLHGVHFGDEAYGKEAFQEDRYCLCTSRVDEGDYFGRVSYYLKQNSVDKETICYLCGNSDMIDEVTTILESYGIVPENIRTEVFF